MPGAVNAELDFDKARKKITGEELKGNNPILDVLGFLHLKNLMVDDYINSLYSLINAYERSSDLIHPLLKIDAPKANYTIRPMARPVLKEWLIYEAIVDWIARRISNNGHICSRSYSILPFKDEKIRSTKAWLQFDEHTNDFIEQGFEHLVLSDLTGYYENVNHRELKNRIIDCVDCMSDNRTYIHALFHMLEKWSDERIQGYGLPQGPAGSAFLADIYLDYVDRRMEKYEGYFRFMDDIRIFCKSEIEAKIALKELIITLRELKLNINAKKTSILRSDEIHKTLFDPQKSLMNLIDVSMSTKDQNQIKKIIPHLMKLFKNSFADDPFEKRHLNFSLYRLGILHMSGFEFDTAEVIKFIVDNFISSPHHAGLFLYFLSMFPNNIEVAHYLFSFLLTENNIYEMQELRVLQTLLRSNAPMSEDIPDFYINSAQNIDRHFAVRGFYFILAGKLGTNRDRDLIVSCYDKVKENYIKKAIILATQEIPSRTSFYSRIKRIETNQEIIQFLDYVKSLSQPTYFLSIERPKIETYEEYEEPGYESF